MLIARLLSSYWLRAVPRAVRALRDRWSGLELRSLLPLTIVVGLCVALSSLGSVAVLGCTPVTAALAGGSASSGPDGSASSSGGGGTDAGSACSPADVSSYVPSAYAAAQTPSDSCLAGDGGSLWEAYYDACLGPAKSSASCNAFSAANAACAACILTSYSAGRLGPIIDYGDFVGGNVAGCIQVLSPTELPCARSVQALTDCEIVACQANCPVSDATSLTARESCGDLADSTGCTTYSAAATSCQSAETDAGLDSPCTITGFKAFYDAVVPLFCGKSAVTGASPDAGSSVDGGRMTAGDDASVESDGAAVPDEAGSPDLAVDAAAE
jgi:hypothetical protein